MRVLLFVLLPIACDSSSTPADGSADQSEPIIDLCDLDAFSGHGNTCPFASNITCFPLCEAGGCECLAGPGGPKWKCTTDLSCLPDASDSGKDASDSGKDAGVTDTGPADADASETD